MTEPPGAGYGGDTAARRRAAAEAGHRGDGATARALLDDANPAVRATAVGALARLGILDAESLAPAMVDPDSSVRRRAAELVAAAGHHGNAPIDPLPSLLPLLDDEEPSVVEVAAWACGELDPPEAGTVARLVDLVTTHDDALVREAAVAALGAIGAPEGLDAVLAATRDKATVRRRAVIALAAFEGEAVDAALLAARDDRDWQVRQAAEDLDLG